MAALKRSTHYTDMVRTCSHLRADLMIEIIGTGKMARYRLTHWGYCWLMSGSRVTSAPPEGFAAAFIARSDAQSSTMQRAPRTRARG